MLQDEYVELPFPAIEFDPKQRLAIYIRKQHYGNSSEVQDMIIGRGNNWM